MPEPPTPTSPSAARTTDASAAARTLREACGDFVHLPGEPAYEARRVPWNVAVDQRPAAVASVRSADDVVSLVRAAQATGLRIAPQGTGHGAGPLAGRDLSGVVLLRMDALREVGIEPRSTAWQRSTGRPPTSGCVASPSAAGSGGTRASTAWPATQ